MAVPAVVDQVPEDVGLEREVGGGRRAPRRPAAGRCRRASAPGAPSAGSAPTRGRRRWRRSGWSAARRRSRSRGRAPRTRCRSRRCGRPAAPARTWRCRRARARSARRSRARACARSAPRSACRGEPFGVYIGKTTRCSTPSRRCELGPEEVQRGAEVGLAEAALDPRLQVGARPGRGSPPGAGSAARGRRWPRPSSTTSARTSPASCAARSTSPLGSCRRRSASVASLRRSHAGSCAASETTGVESGAERGQRAQYSEVEPELPVVALGEVVVAEEVGVGGDHHAALACRDGGEQAGAGRVGRGARAQHHARRRRPPPRRRPGRSRRRAPVQEAGVGGLRRRPRRGPRAARRRPAP